LREGGRAPFPWEEEKSGTNGKAGKGEGRGGRLYESKGEGEGAVAFPKSLAKKGKRKGWIRYHPFSYCWTRRFKKKRENNSKGWLEEKKEKGEKKGQALGGAT